MGIVRRVLTLPSKLYNYILLKYRHVNYGENLIINGRLFCVSNSKDGIKLGNNVRINSCRKSNPIGGDDKTILFAKGKGKIRIDDGCGLSNNTLFACESIMIGKNVLIGGGTKIYDTDFHWIELSRRLNELGGATKPVIIKDGAFIGAHCIILKGVTIGEESIVGAGSVVTKDIPNGEIWAGNPAKYIRKVGEKNEFNCSWVETVYS